MTEQEKKDREQEAIKIIMHGLTSKVPNRTIYGELGERTTYYKTDVVIYEFYTKAFEMIGREETKKLLIALVLYANDGTEPEEFSNPLTELFFTFMRLIDDLLENCLVERGKLLLCQKETKESICPSEE